MFKRQQSVLCLTLKGSFKNTQEEPGFARAHLLTQRIYSEFHQLHRLQPVTGWVVAVQASPKAPHRDSPFFSWLFQALSTTHYWWAGILSAGGHRTDLVPGRTPEPWLVSHWD